MGLLGDIIAKGIATAAKNSTIKAVGDAATNVIVASAERQNEKEDVVVKNGVSYIKPTRSSEEYRDKNALEIAKELFGVGFESIELKPIKKLGEHSKKKYGRIVSISINGKSDFLGIKKIPTSSYIIIEYLDFNKNVDNNVYEGINRISSGVKHNITELEVKLQENDNKKSFVADDAKNFCPFCGQSIKYKEAKFCSGCGKEL